MPARPNPRQGLEARVDSHGVEHFRASVRIPGTTKKKRGRWTPRIAEAKAERARLLAMKGTLTAAIAYPTVAEAADVFLTRAEAGQAWARGGKPYAPKTLRGYRSDFRDWINPAIGTVKVDQLRRSQVQALVDSVAAVRSGQRARNIVTAVAALYRHLLPRHDDLRFDPTDGLELPAGSPPRDVIVTPDELLALLDALNEYDRAPFALLGMAGLRAGELKALTVDDVILDDHGHLVPDRIVVRAGWDAVVGRAPLKHRREGEGREVPIFAPLRPYVEAQLASLGPDVEGSDPFVPGKGRHGRRVGLGVALDTDHLLVRCREAWGWRRRAKPGGGTEVVAIVDEPLAPLAFRLHDARHSFASHLVVAGYDVATVAEWIGHRHASTTLDRYVKPLRQRGVDPARVRAYFGE